MGRDRLVRLALLAAAWLSTAGWALLLYSVALPWHDLGGVVSERLRWLLRFCLLAGLWTGFVAADALQAFVHGSDEERPWDPRALRRLLYPAAVGTAGTMIVLRLAGADDAIGIALTALVAYATGVWLRVTGLVGLATRSSGEELQEGPVPQTHCRDFTARLTTKIRVLLHSASAGIRKKPRPRGL